MCAGKACAMVTAHGQGFGVLPRQLRSAAHLTQEELADRAGLSARGIQDLERGVHDTPHPATVRRLADALGLSDAERSNLPSAANRDISSDGFALAPPRTRILAWPRLAAARDTHYACDPARDDDQVHPVG